MKIYSVNSIGVRNASINKRENSQNSNLQNNSSRSNSSEPSFGGFFSWLSRLLKKNDKVKISRVIDGSTIHVTGKKGRKKVVIYDHLYSNDNRVLDDDVVKRLNIKSTHPIDLRTGKKTNHYK